MLELLAWVALLAAAAADVQEQKPKLPLLPQRKMAGPRTELDAEAATAKQRLINYNKFANGEYPFTYFVSGASRPAHIRGLRRIGMNVGVVASEMSAEGVEELKRMGAQARPMLDAFIDSGAFEEFTHPMKVQKLQNRIEALEEKQATKGLSSAERTTLVNAPARLNKLQSMEMEPDWMGEGRQGRSLKPVIPLYDDMGATFGEWLHVVAPDKIADQEETLRRMRRYGPQIVDLVRKWGVEVFVPLQWGENTLAEFEEKALQAMGVPPSMLANFVPAMPLKAAALPWEDVLAYVRRWHPQRIHLLGVGPKRRAELGRPSGLGMVKEILEISPFTEISMDSALIPATTGKTSGPGKGPRQLERARMILAEQGFSPTDVQELAMVVAWPDLYMATVGKHGWYQSRWLAPTPLPVLPIEEFKKVWTQQLLDAGMPEAAQDFQQNIEDQRERFESINKTRREQAHRNRLGMIYRLAYNEPMFTNRTLITHPNWQNDNGTVRGSVSISRNGPSLVIFDIEADSLEDLEQQLHSWKLDGFGIGVRNIGTDPSQDKWQYWMQQAQRGLVHMLWNDKQAVIWPPAEYEPDESWNGPLWHQRTERGE